jgi:2-hydroxymuconate-semialdehyde hydrolase
VTFVDKSFDLNGVRVHYQEGGTGLPLLMIHGSGPGASSLGNWRPVLQPLAEHFHVFAMDLIGFGLSGRKPAPPFFDFSLWLRQCHEMIARMPGDQVGVIGHSLSGALALKLAGASPKVQKVLTTGSMGTPFRINEYIDQAWTFPRDRSELQRAAKALVFDHALIDDTYLGNREAVLFQGDYQAYFTRMFEGNKQRYIDDAVLTAEELSQIRCQVAMLHGRNDLAVPAEETTLVLARAIPQADITLIARCSHSVAMEHPKKLMAAANGLFS